MNKYRVSAFTIIEITVSMLISGIVIGITYSVYLIISQSYITFHKKSEESALLVRMDELLKKDFADADSISKTQNGILLIKDGTTITYEFQPDFVVRTGNITDTFKFVSQDVNTLFENQQITEVKSSVSNNRIDELSLIILFNDEKIPYHYYKKYSSENLIGRMIHVVD